MTTPQTETVENFLKNRQSLATNPYRPLYHFSPPGFGLHDPAGLCRWQGKYHLFYLLSIPDVLWGRGHAVSDDLVHWRDLPMLPTEIRGGTGQVWTDKDRVILGNAAPTFATASDPMLLDWTEQADEIGGDNFIWHKEDYYYLVRNGRRKATSLEILRSRDLTQWESLGLYMEDSSFTDPGTDCSCPNIVSLGNGKHLILFYTHNQGPKALSKNNIPNSSYHAIMVSLSQYPISSSVFT